VTATGPNTRFPVQKQEKCQRMEERGGIARKCKKCIYLFQTRACQQGKMKQLLLYSTNLIQKVIAASERSSKQASKQSSGKSKRTTRSHLLEALNQLLLGGAQASTPPPTANCQVEESPPPWQVLLAGAFCGQLQLRVAASDNDRPTGNRASRVSRWPGVGQESASSKRADVDSIKAR